MKFEYLLEEYDMLVNRCRRLKNDLDNKELQGYLQGITSMFLGLKAYCDNYKLETRPVREDEKFKDQLDDNTRLIEVLDYRGYSIPIYDDDYGQQIVGYWEDEILCGGSYNAMGEYDIADQFDRLLIKKEFNL